MTTRVALKFDIAINELWPGEKLPVGDPRWGQYTHSFQKESHTLESLIKRITVDGCSFCPVMRSSHRKADNFISAQHIDLDDDRGTQESSLASLAADLFIADHAAFLYESPSSTPEKPKTRVVFILDSPLTTATDCRTAQEAMLWRFQGTDEHVKDPARLFYGRPNAQVRNLGNILYGDVLQQEVIEPYLQSGQHQSNGHKTAEAIGNTIPEGERNATLLSLAGTMQRRGFLLDAIIAALRIENQEKGIPTLEDTEVEGIARSVSRYSPAPKSNLGSNEVSRQEDAAGIGGPQVVRLGDVEPEPVIWLWNGYIVRGKVNLIAGDPGLGKSWVTLDIAARLTVGGETPDRQHRMEQGAVVLLTAEDGLADTVRPRIDVQGGDASLVHVLEGIVDPDGQERLPSLVEDIATLEQLVLSVHARLVIIDPVNAYLGRTDSHVDAQIRRVLTPLAKMAERTGAAIVVVMHLNQSTLQPALYRVQGSIGYVGAARSVLLMVRDKDNPALRIMAPIKANLVGEMPALSFTITDEPALSWQGAVEVDIAELLAASSPEEQGAREEAKRFLGEMLADGEAPGTEVVKEARECGISEKTLRRAAKDMGVDIARVGQVGKRGGGVWIWRLPEGVDGQDALHDKSGHVNQKGHVDNPDGDIKMATPKDPLGTNDIKMATLNVQEKLGNLISDGEQSGHLNHPFDGDDDGGGHLNNPCVCPIPEHAKDGGPQPECPSCHCCLWCTTCGGCIRCKHLAIQSVGAIHDA